MNALSIHLRAEVHRDGKVFEQEYSKGKPLYDVREIGNCDKTGTKVTFRPDNTIFESTEYNYETLENRLRELAFLNKGIKISITDKRNTDDEGNYIKSSFVSEGGLKEFVLFLDQNREQLIDDVITSMGSETEFPWKWQCCTTPPIPKICMRM